MPFSEQNDCLSTSLITKIVFVYRMVFVQTMTQNKKGIFGTVKGLAESFKDRLTGLIVGFNEVILVFDLHKPDSLKERTRERCQQGKTTRLKMIQTSFLALHDIIT